MPLGSLDHVYYWVSNMDRSVQFYRDVVGLELARRDDDNWAELGSGPVRVALHGTKDGLPAETGGATVAFRVEDLDRTRASLGAQGVAFVHEGEVEGYGRFALFPDPDGNLIEVIEFAPERT
jgi:catechol 2,3-dioxygenase-like lactoylglutathione lyase family enzyme